MALRRKNERVPDAEEGKEETEIDDEWLIELEDEDKGKLDELLL